MSNLQDKWLIRSRLLWRIKGIVLPCATSNILTNEEQELVNLIMDCRHKILKNAINSSRQLGFNARPRCCECNNKEYAFGYCKKHLTLYKEELRPLYFYRMSDEEIDEYIEQKHKELLTKYPKIKHA